MGLPATVGDVESLKAEIKELKRLILSMKSVTPVINVSYPGTGDDIKRSMRQMSRSL